MQPDIGHRDTLTIVRHLDPERALVPAPAPDLPVPVANSADLLGSSRELVILHGTDAYRLRITRHGKLILTK